MTIGTPKSSERFRGLVASLLVSPAARVLTRPMMARRSTIFMLHRRSEPSLSIVGRTEAQVRAAIESVRASGAQVLGLDELARFHADTGKVVPNSVCLTIDDGYADQAGLARAALAVGCPVTIFLVTGFLDGCLWPWDQRLWYAVSKCPRPVLELQANGGLVQYSMATPDDRRRSCELITVWAKALPQDQVEDVVTYVAKAAEVGVPICPPLEHVPLAWSEVRALEAEGVRFGAHSVSHRILSRLSESEARAEICNSLARVEDETTNPSQIFAWPTGRQGDYGRREQEMVMNAGSAAAVSTGDGFAVWPRRQESNIGRYELQRFSLPTQTWSAIECSSYVERAKVLLGR